MIGKLLKTIIAKRMAAAMAKVADEVKEKDPGLEGEFRKVQKGFKNLEANLDWYCKRFPDSVLCKERVQPKFNSKYSPNYKK